MTDFPQWTPEQLETDLSIAISAFREERLQEPLEAYLEAFDECQGEVEVLLETTVDLSRLGAITSGVLGERGLLEALRYLSGPPISEDDLKTLADIRSLSASSLRSDEEAVRRIVRVVMQGLDRRRFDWVSGEREPTEAERNAAVVASAALMATRRAATARRNEGKRKQEASVARSLLSAGFQQVRTRSIPVLEKAPQLGEFCGESKLGQRKADFIIRLWDLRIMPVECKVSNSSTNSVKRLNNDAAAKAEEWRNDFGSTQVVPTAVLSGAYRLHNLQEAQRRGLAIFWAHDLQSFLSWIEKTRTA